MMRIKAGIFCALAMALAFACADSGMEDEDDNMGSNGSGGSSQNMCGDGTCAALGSLQSVSTQALRRTWRNSCW